MAGLGVIGRDRYGVFPLKGKLLNVRDANFKRAGVEKYITLIEGDAHKEVTKLTDKIDIVFLDADKAGYVDYLKKLLPLVRPGGLIIAHNTTSHGKWMEPYLKAVTTDKNLETLFLNVKPAGVGVTMKKR